MDRIPSKGWARKLFESQPLLYKNNYMVDGAPSAPPPSPTSFSGIKARLTKSDGDINAIEMENIHSPGVGAGMLQKSQTLQSSCDTLFYPLDDLVWPETSSNEEEPVERESSPVVDDTSYRFLPALAALGAFLGLSFVTFFLFGWPKGKA